MVQPKPAPSASLAARKVVTMTDQGLHSTDGARRVIDAISSRKLVTSLNVGHNQLGDDGCEELFRYLCSEAGKRYGIVEIHLLANSIGDRGLLALSKYLKGNPTLKDLLIQNNALSGDRHTVLTFTEGVNTSQLETLVMSSNFGDSDSLVSHFFATLNSPTLRDLQLSTSRLSFSCVPAIVSHLASPKCRLQTLRLSGNQLGKRGTVALVECIESTNFSLLKLEIFGNAVAQASPEDGDDDGGLTPEVSQQISARLKAVLARNSHLKRQVERDAFSLLRHSRAVLLHSNSPPSESSRYFPRLPIEIQLHVLSVFAPTLSTAQRIRVFNYASTPNTLPKLLPSLKSSACVPDPSGFAFGGGGIGPGIGFGLGSKGCTNGRCMGAGNSVICRREGERMKYLTEVGCTSFEPESWGF